MLGSVQDAEDALQEMLLRAWRGAAGLRQGSSARSWLYAIAAPAVAAKPSERRGGVPCDRSLVQDGLIQQAHLYGRRLQVGQLEPVGVRQFLPLCRLSVPRSVLGATSSRRLVFKDELCPERCRGGGGRWSGGGCWLAKAVPMVAAGRTAAAEAVSRGGHRVRGGWASLRYLGSGAVAGGASAQHPGSAALSGEHGSARSQLAAG
jgi:hypothetical protein